MLYKTIKKIRNYVCGPPTVDSTVECFAKALAILQEVEESRGCNTTPRDVREVERARGVSSKIHQILGSELF